MFVLQYEQKPKGPIPAPEHDVVASLNTHDMPTFAAHLDGDDIQDRANLGLIPRKEIPREKISRQLLRKNLINRLRSKKLLKTNNPGNLELTAAALRFLAQSDAETVLVNLEDLWQEKRPQNTPGTSTERPNWRGKAKLSLEQMENSKAVNEILSSLATDRPCPKPPQQPRSKRKKSS